MVSTAGSLVGRPWRPVGARGALPLLTAAASAPALLRGAPVLYLGLAGFVVWLAFVVRASIALLGSNTARG